MKFTSVVICLILIFQACRSINSDTVLLESKKPSFVSYVQKCSESENQESYYFQLKRELMPSKQQFKSKMDIIKKLDRKKLSGLLLNYESGSNQGGTRTSPRVILFQRPLNSFEVNGALNTIIAFNSDERRSRDANTPEFDLVDFSAKHNVFCPRSISLGEDGLVFDDSPKECADCHGQPFNPIWDPYPLWPHFFGSSDGLIETGTLEDQYARELIQNIDMSPVLTFLETKKIFKKEDSFGRISLEDPIEFQNYLTMRSILSIASRLVETKDHDRYKFVLAGGLLDCENIPGFLPPEIRENHPKTYEVIKAETRDLLERGFRAGLKKFEHFNKDVSDKFLNQDLEEDNFFHSIVALRYLLENRSVNAEPFHSWSMSSVPNHYAFSGGGIGLPNVDYYYFRRIFSDNIYYSSLLKSYPSGQAPKEESYIFNKDLKSHFFNYARDLNKEQKQKKADLCTKLKADSLNAFVE